MNNWKGKSVWSVADNFSQQLLSFVIFALLARLLTPHEFGLLAVAHLMVQFVRMTVLDAMAMPIVRGSIDKNAGNRPFDWLFSLCTTVSILLALLMAMFSPLLARLFSSPSLVPVLLGMSLVIVLFGLVRAHEARLIRIGNFRLLAIRSIISVCVGGVVALVMASKGAGAMALVAQQLTTGLVALLIAVVAEWSHWKPRWFWSNGLIRTHVQEMGKVGSAALLNYAKNNIDVLIVSMLLGSYATGLYNLAKRVLSAAYLVIAVSLGRVGVTKFVHEQQDDNALRKTYLSMMAVTFLLLVPLYTLASALAEPMVVVVFGAQWRPSAALFGWLSIAYLAQTSFEMGQNLSFATGRASRVPRFALRQLLISSGAALAFGFWFGLSGVVFGFAIGSVVGMVEMQVFIGQQFAISLRKLVLAILPAIIGALCCFAAARALPFTGLDITGWYTLAAASAVCLSAYFVSAFVTRRLI